MFYSKIEDLDSFKRVINQLITLLIILGLCISFIAIGIIYSGFEKKSKELNKELVRNANSILQSNISERLSILVNNQEFVSYLNKGEFSRKINVIDMMILFKNFIDADLILGIKVNNKTDNLILNLGLTQSKFHIKLELCYLNDQINNQFGNCYNKITIFISKKAYLSHLSKINPNIQKCEENHKSCVKFDLFSSSKFGSFIAENFKDEFISINYISPSTFEFFIPAIIIILISTLALLTTHRVIKILTHKYLSKPIREIESNLKSNMPLKNIYIKEISYLANEIEEYQQFKVEIELGKNLAQIAHDMRSPLLAVDSFFCLVEGKLEESERIFGRRAIRRLDDIVWSLLYKYKNKGESNYKIDDEYVFLHSCIQELLSEKRMEYSKLNIDFEFLVDIYDVFSMVYLSAANLKRMLSNIINNAVNAITTNKGFIEISLKSNIAGSLISIKDNGKGMAHELINEILISSQGKNSKTNLGLPHAIKFLEQVDGKLDISSKVDIGTIVTISLPPCEVPAWCFNEYQINNEEELILIDDSNSVHEVWDEMLKNFQHLKYQHLYSLKEALNFFETLTNNKSLVIFCDYEFFDEEQNGIDILKHAPKNSEKVLVTSHLYNSSIMKNAVLNGIKILPKELVPYLKLTDKEQQLNLQDQISLIFIDDEPRNTQSWQFFAKAKKLKIATYNDIKQFFIEAAKYNKNIPIYVDLDLLEEKSGIDYAKEISELGFEKIYISTGSVDITLKQLQQPWITGIIEKRFPFI